MAHGAATQDPPDAPRPATAPAPLAVKAQVPMWDDPGAAARIMQRIKAQLDPNNLLNPGRFVAGI